MMEGSRLLTSVSFEYRALSETQSVRQKESERNDDEIDVIKEDRRLFGSALAILAGLSFTSATLLQKLKPSLSFFFLLLFRSGSQILLFIPFLLLRDDYIIYRERNTRILSQGFVGGILLLCIFVSISRIPIGDASAIFFSAPLFTMILSALFLREPYGLFRLFVSLLLLFGIIILCRPSFAFPPHSSSEIPANESLSDSAKTIVKTEEFEIELFGFCVALVVPILSAIITILTRQCKEVAFTILAFWFGVGGLTVASGGILISMMTLQNFESELFPSSWTEILYSVLIVVLGIIGNVSMTISLRHVTPSQAMVTRSFEVVLNYILQVTVFTAVPFHLSDSIGAGFIMVSVIIMGLESQVLRAWSWKYL